MRLLHTSTYKLKSFYSKTDRPPYAILSHTWGQDELGFEAIQTDIHEKLKSPKRGLCKVRDACLQARRDRLDYLWVDTCCIDKSSSTELSEALNSMFVWYQQSSQCYVFMEDVTLIEDGTMANFDASRWFTRGWTLQELIAPHGLTFFDRYWRAMKTRDQIADRLEKITGIGRDILVRHHDDLPGDNPDPTQICPACGYNDGLRRILRNEPISRKMKWAAKRTTTREEDAAYCLMGLFDINMALLYGEGDKAFERLQQKILLNAPDQSILTWVDKPKRVRNAETCLAPRLSAFNVENLDVCRARFAADVEQGDIIATARGLELDVLFGPCVFSSSTSWAPLELFLAVLNCTIEPDNLSRVAILVKALQPKSPNTAYGRACHDNLVILRPDSSPSILSRSFTRDGPETFDLKRQNCDYDISKFKPRRILLSGLASPWDKVGSNTQKCPRLKLEIQDCGEWHSKVRNKDLLENEMILMRQNLHHFKGRRIDGMLVYGVLLISNGRSSFFIILGLENYLSIPESDPHYTCWVEPWDSLMMGEIPASRASSLSEGTFKHAIHQYMERHDRHKLRSRTAQISRRDFQVRVEIKLVEFLQRRGYSLMVHIGGWDIHPISVVDYLLVDYVR